MRYHCVQDVRRHAVPPTRRHGCCLPGLDLSLVAGVALKGKAVISPTPWNFLRLRYARDESPVNRLSRIARQARGIPLHGLRPACLLLCPPTHRWCAYAAPGAAFCSDCPSLASATCRRPVPQSGRACRLWSARAGRTKLRRATSAQCEIRRATARRRRAVEAGSFRLRAVWGR